MGRSNEKHTKLHDTNGEQPFQLTGIVLDRFYDGLYLLLQASNYSYQFSDLFQGMNEFAVGIGELHREGLTYSDLCWLVHHGYLIHLIETTSDQAKSRKFKDAKNLKFGHHSCFSLTEEGITLAQQLSVQKTRQSHESRNDGNID